MNPDGKIVPQVTGIAATGTPPVSILKRWKQAPTKSGFLPTPTEHEWAIQNHRALPNGRVDWKSTAQELANGWGVEQDQCADSGKALAKASQDADYWKNEATRQAQRFGTIRSDANRLYHGLWSHWAWFLLPAKMRTLIREML